MTKDEFLNLCNHTTIVRVTATNEEGEAVGANASDIVTVEVDGVRKDFGYAELEIISQS